MRAEMTVGLDLKSLENLRIYNGYETGKKEKRLSLELPSSPEDNTESDASQHEPSINESKSHSKSKCGRPANPIPRHKRDSHIKAEYKRRDKIQKGFDTLMTLVPELSDVSEKESKAKMLFKTADYCRRIKSECGSTQIELSALRQELAALGSDIQQLQDKLPRHGIETTKKQDNVTMDMLYDQYLKEERQKNWKFWIFGFFMRPLYDSFKQSTAGKQNTQEFSSSVFQWIQSSLSLTNLRKGFLDALRKISTQTSIMTNPESLEQEARARHSDHCVTTSRMEAPSQPRSPLTPPSTPRGQTPSSSAHQTPVATPTPTPPRTPNLSRHSSRRDKPKSQESRSRSNSPSQEETKPKRRSNYRSRSGRRSTCEEDIAKMEYATTVSSSPMPLLSQLLTSSKMEGVSHFGVASDSKDLHVKTENTTNTRDCSIKAEQNAAGNTSSPDVMTLQGDKLVQTLVESLISAMEPNQPRGKSRNFNETAVTKYSLSRSSLTNQSSVHQSGRGHFMNSIGSDPKIVACDIGSTQSRNTFIPVNRSGIISNGSVIRDHEVPVSEHQHFTDQVHTTMSSSLFPMDLMASAAVTSSMDIHNDSDMISDTISRMSNNTDLLLTQMLSPSNEEPISMETCHCHSSHMTSVSCSGHEMLLSSHGLMSAEDDSMTDLLNIDVMDVNSVLTFFNEDKLTNS